jgi:hypothetical protein
MVKVGDRSYKATCEHCGIKFISGVLLKCKTCGTIIKGQQGVYPLDCRTCGAVQSHWLTATPPARSTRSAPPLATATPSSPQAATPNAPVKKHMNSTQRGFLIFVVFVVVLAAIGGIIGAVTGGGPSAKVTGKVTNVLALNGNTLRIYIIWTNTGKAAGSGSCILNTTVYNQFGDNVNIEVNSTSTNGSLKPGQSQNLYQDIGVNNGDAQYIKSSDVKILDC